VQHLDDFWSKTFIEATVTATTTTIDFKYDESKPTALVTALDSLPKWEVACSDSLSIHITQQVINKQKYTYFVNFFYIMLHLYNCTFTIFFIEYIIDFHQDETF
jgi:hypothetical protein